MKSLLERGDARWPRGGGGVEKDVGGKGGETFVSTGGKKADPDPSPRDGCSWPTEGDGEIQHCRVEKGRGCRLYDADRKAKKKIPECGNKVGDASDVENLPAIAIRSNRGAIPQGL